MSNVINLGNQCTFSAWVKMNSGQSQIQMVLGNAVTGAGANGFLFYVNTYNTGDKKFILETGNGGNGKQAGTTAGAVTSAVWRHLAAVVDRSGGTANLYVDGVDKTSVNSVKTAFATNQTVYLGTFPPPNVTQYPFHGVLDEMRVDTVARSSNWVWA